jgi:lipopolysaccharide transport protein LptA
MALSRSSLRLLLGLALAPLAAHATAAAGTTPATARASAASIGQPLPINPQQKIKVDCQSGNVDYKTNTMICSHIVISQGSTRVRADHARGTGGLNFQNSRWTFAGNVQIDAPPRGSLRSDQATVEFRDNRIAGATITGNPAEFEQQRAGDLGMEKGHADQIVYDVSQGTVLLTNDAWISDGHNEMSAPSISYSIREQKVLATSASASQGVHITITPQSPPKQGAPPEGKGAESPPHGSGTPPAPAQPHPSATGVTPASPPQGH